MNILLSVGYLMVDPSAAFVQNPHRSATDPHKLSLGNGRTDIYSLGATMYAMLTGQPPLQADTVHELVNKIRLEAPVPLKGQQLGLPEPLEHINQKMLAKRPEDRYQSAKEVVKHLEALAKSHNLQV